MGNAGKKQRSPDAKARVGDKDEAAYLASYKAKDYPRPSVTVDLVVLSILEGELRLLLIKRLAHPFKGRWALPGGFVRVGDGFEDQGEDLEHAALRELAEETGLPEGSIFIEQLYTFGRAYRDPRMRVITVAYYALLRPELAVKVVAGSDASEATWWSLSQPGQPELAFDHQEILERALTRIRGKLDYSDIAFELVPATFTIAELRAVHEVIQATSYDPGNFRRRFNRMLTDGIIEDAPGHRPTSTRPARLYRFRGR